MCVHSGLTSKSHQHKPFTDSQHTSFTSPSGTPGSSVFLIHRRDHIVRLVKFQQDWRVLGSKHSGKLGSGHTAKTHTTETRKQAQQQQQKTTPPWQGGPPRGNPHRIHRFLLATNSINGALWNSAAQGRRSDASLKGALHGLAMHPP